jgi:hypothetical protein
MTIFFVAVGKRSSETTRALRAYCFEPNYEGIVRTGGWGQAAEILQGYMRIFYINKL